MQNVLQVVFGADSVEYAVLGLRNGKSECWGERFRRTAGIGIEMRHLRPTLLVESCDAEAPEGRAREFSVSSVQNMRQAV